MNHTITTTDQIQGGIVSMWSAIVPMPAGKKKFLSPPDSLEQHLEQMDA